MPGDRHPGAARQLTGIIRRARREEAEALRELARRSKAHWPYRPDFLARVRPLLQLDEQDVERHEEAGALEDLWLEPAPIGTGRGRQLFEHAVAVARRHRATHLDWDAEPYAEGVYRAMGGVEIWRTPSMAEAGRTLPRTRLELSGRAAAGAGPAPDAAPDAAVAP